MVIHMVQFLINEMKFPKEKIVDFAECNEMFPSPLIEKVSQLPITTLTFVWFDFLLKYLIKGLYRLDNNNPVSPSTRNGEYLILKLSVSISLNRSSDERLEFDSAYFGQWIFRLWVVIRLKD